MRKSQERGRRSRPCCRSALGSARLALEFKYVSQIRHLHLGDRLAVPQSPEACHVLDLAQFESQQQCLTLYYRNPNTLRRTIRQAGCTPRLASALKGLFPKARRDHLQSPLSEKLTSHTLPQARSPTPPARPEPKSKRRRRSRQSYSSRHDRELDQFVLRQAISQVKRANQAVLTKQSLLKKSK